MERSRKKELKEQYQQMKKDMGIFIIRSKTNNKCYIQTSKDLKGAINSTKLKLSVGSHPYQELQKEWNDFGQDKFTIEILEKLEYDEDASKTDYADDLVLLQMIWEEKLTGQNVAFYGKRL